MKTKLFSRINSFTWLMSVLILFNATQINADCFSQVTIATKDTSAITTSGNYTDADRGFQAFDRYAHTMWISSIGTPAWIAYDFGKPVTVDRYSINYVNGSITTRAPKNWELQGFDGYNWITVDSRNDEINWTGYQRRSYDVSNPGSYQSYRLYVTDDNDIRAGVVVISIGGLSLESCNIFKVEGDWQMDQLRSANNAGQIPEKSGYYVPDNLKLGATRYRQMYKFHSNGVAEVLRVGPTDGHYFVTGTWSLWGDQLTLNYTDITRSSGAFVDKFQVIEADENHLLLKNY